MHYTSLLNFFSISGIYKVEKAINFVRNRIKYCYQSSWSTFVHRITIQDVKINYFVNKLVVDLLAIDWACSKKLYSIYFLIIAIMIGTFATYTSGSKYQLTNK